MKNKYQIKIQIAISLVICLLFISCVEKEQLPEEKETETLFTVMGVEDTGLNFNNKLKETTRMNGFYYEYFYNGGGVAVADFNNDGLQDIYFISNLRTNKLYLNQGGLKFRNVSIKANAQGKEGFPTGVTLVDINNDGLMDIYILKSGRFETDDPLRNELLINKGTDSDNIPVFEESAKAYGLDLPHYSTQASFFDYDQDGDLDMFLVNHNIEIYEIDNIEEIRKKTSDKIGAKLYRNDEGKFINVTQEAGIISNNLGFGLGVAIGDVNNDGWPDVYVSNDYYEKDHLYINKKDGTFTETSLESFRHMSTFSMGCDIGDFNNDGLLDIISLDMMAEDNYTQKTSMSGMNVSDFYRNEDLGLHRQYMYNALQMNNGVFPETDVPVFSDIAQLAGISSTDWSWAPLLFDMNNDGHKDLFVSNGIKRDFRNNDFLIYLEKKYREGVRKKDVNLEQHVDDLLEKLPARGKKNYFFLNNGNMTFNRLAVNQPETYSSGAAYADFDNDGDLDVVVNNTDEFALLYRNNSKHTSFININLLGSNDNKDALGARVELFIKAKKYTAENYYTRGFQSAMAVPLHFGLGNASKIDSIKVLWPNGKYQSMQNIEINQSIDITYNPIGESVFEKVRKDIQFQDITKKSGISYLHKENEYNDFDIESLIPHKMSRIGPGLSVADVNNDGLEDFFIGGAMDQSGVLYIQSLAGKFNKKEIPAFEADKNYEDTGALFFDADNDGDQDLYVVSGGNEKEPGSLFYQDRFYINDGNGNFKKSTKAIPEMTISGKVITAGDFDDDGDLDLFVGSRVKPMNYGFPSKSYLLENRSVDGKIKFVDVTDYVIPDLMKHGMVTDALWVDIDADGNLELIIAQEWGSIEIFKKKEGKFINVSEKYGLNKQVGWWYGLASYDIDNDGDLDLIAGNLGLNYKYMASKEEPFHLYLNDFDKNGSNDIVLGYQQDNILYPLRGMECTSNQMPFVKQKFKTYDAFAKADLQKIYGDGLDSSIHMTATNFANSILENINNEYFNFKPLPNSVQISSIDIILVDDINGDKKKDLILLGNLYGSEVETPRNDASYGHYMRGMGNGKFKNIAAKQSGLYVKGDVKGAIFISLGKNKKKALLIARNDDALQLLQINKNKK